MERSSFPITSLHVHLANEWGFGLTRRVELRRIVSFIELKRKLEKESERWVYWFLAYFRFCPRETVPLKLATKDVAANDNIVARLKERPGWSGPATCKCNFQIITDKGGQGSVLKSKREWEGIALYEYITRAEIFRNFVNVAQEGGSLDRETRSCSLWMCYTW